MLNKYGQGGGLNAGLSLWLPLNDLGAGAVNTVPANSSGDGTATFTRATAATTFDVTGTAPISVATGVARSYYNPASHVYLGYLAEEQRTNLLLNSTINGANLATQSVTVTAQAYTLSFYGTGTVTLSGTAVATDVGSGAYPTRSIFTFTPTAGTLTLTVTGTVQYANLEAGSFATSFIPTAGATVTRNADVLTYPASGNVIDAAGTAYAEGTPFDSSRACSILINNEVSGYYLNRGSGNNAVAFDATNVVTGGATNWTSGVTGKVCTVWFGSSLKTGFNGALGTVGSYDGTFPGATTNLGIGQAGNSNAFNGAIKNVRLWNRALADSQLVSLTS